MSDEQGAQSKSVEDLSVPEGGLVGKESEFVKATEQVQQFSGVGRLHDDPLLHKGAIRFLDDASATFRIFQCED